MQELRRIIRKLILEVKELSPKELYTGMKKGSLSDRLFDEL